MQCLAVSLQGLVAAPQRPALHAQVRSTEPGDLAALGALLGARVKVAHAALHARALERLALRRPEYARTVIASLLWQARRPATVRASTSHS